MQLKMIPEKIKIEILWLHRINLGYGLKNKLRLIGIPILLSFDQILEKILVLNLGFERLTNEICQNTIVNIDGIKYCLIDPGSLDILSHDFESFVDPWLEPRKSEVFIDIGANIGKYALRVAKITGAMTIALEPHPSNYRTLKKNAKLNGLRNVVTLEVAAWSKNCPLRLNIGIVSGSHSVKICYGLGWIYVTAKSTDNVVEECRLRRVDWIKIDVEGAEYEVLCGLEETLDTYRPKIIVEVFLKNLELVKRFMETHCYGLVRISSLLGDHIYFAAYPY
jgi:FkbM family methyltransferase